MSRLPEAYFIYREQLLKAKEDKLRLKRAYEAELSQLKDEIVFLKEQIDAQHGMIKNSVEYALKLENQIERFKSKLNSESNSFELKGT